MRDFFDTSVLTAAFWRGHVHHEASIRRFATADKKNSGCATHTLAELYATMTALPVRPLIPPEQAMLFIEEVRNRLSLLSGLLGILRDHTKRRRQGTHKRPHL